MSNEKINIQNALININNKLEGIDESLKTIAMFFEKWKAFDIDRPEVYVNADVSTQEA